MQQAMINIGIVVGVFENTDDVQLHCVYNVKDIIFIAQNCTILAYLYKHITWTFA